MLRRARFILLSMSLASALIPLVPGSAAMSRPVVVFGDSLAVGVAGRLRASGLPVTDLGRVGWGLNRSSWRDRVTMLRGVAPGAEGVVIFVGTNDHGAEDALYRSRLSEMRAAVPAGVPVLWLGQPRFCSSRMVGGAEPIDRDLREVAARYGDRFLAPVSGCGAAGRAPDGIHFTPGGYQAIADQVASTMPGRGWLARNAPAASGPASRLPPIAIPNFAETDEVPPDAIALPLGRAPAVRGRAAPPAPGRRHALRRHGARVLHLT